VTNPFEDQARFMRACGQGIPGSTDQWEMYCGLIEEEFQELQEAKDDQEALDALIDILVVTIGAIHSMGADAEGAWNEVMRTNMAKVDPVTGLVRRREDGKILKPQGWQPPDLKQYLRHD
jgi:predicted HAD superfamily Cof-like phosphohydrolase